LPSPPRSPPQSTPKESLLILSKHDHTLAIIDPATLKSRRQSPVGDDPHEVIALLDGKTATSQLRGGGAGPLRTLAVVDLVAQKPSPKSTSARSAPARPRFCRRKTLVSPPKPPRLSGSYDRHKSISSSAPANRTHMIYVAQDSQPYLHTNIASGTVSIF